VFRLLTDRQNSKRRVATSENGGSEIRTEFLLFTRGRDRLFDLSKAKFMGSV